MSWSPPTAAWTPRASPAGSDGRPAGSDARLVGPALGAWLAAGFALGLSPTRAMLAGAALVVVGLLVLHRQHRRTGAILLASAAAVLAAGLRLTASGAGPLPDLAERGVVAEATVTVTSDPVVRPGRFGEFVIAEVRVHELTARGSTMTMRTPALLFGDREWAAIAMGASVRTIVRLEPSDDARHAAVLLPTRIVEVTKAPAWWWRVSGRLRAAIAEGVAPVPTDERALVPALVDGDVRPISEELAADFRACGLTHLLAVSGTNLTLMLGFVLTVARWARVRGYGHVAIGIVATAGFILLARPDPSVLRSAAMGVVAVVGLGAGGRRRGLRALAVAVVVLVLVDPWLARSAGFILSVLATGAILVLAPRWTAALSTWLPRPLAESVSVPLAAQLVCTPVIAVISDQVSLIAVGANILAAPAVGPATVLGLVAGLVSLVWVDLGHLIGWGAAAMAWWIIEVAERGAALPGASVAWTGGGPALAVLIAGCVGLCVVLPRLLASRIAVATVVAVATVGIAQPAMGGWPPRGWILVACDVGQGDAIVLNAGDGGAVVVDTGPEPARVDGCLDQLGVDAVAVVVLTHPHADHIDGLPGVADGRPVGAIAVTDGAADDPAYESVIRWATAHNVPVRELTYATNGSVGAVAWTVLGPPPDLASEAVNDQSVVLSVRTRGVTVLLTGDVEPPAQAAVVAGWDAAQLRADVVKVPHHGSRYQNPGLFDAIDPRLAIVSVGENDYGHPAPETLDLLADAGAVVVRTDQVGDLAVLVRDGALATATR